VVRVFFGGAQALGNAASIRRLPIQTLSIAIGSENDSPTVRCPGRNLISSSEGEPSYGRTPFEIVNPDIEFPGIPDSNCNVFSIRRKSWDVIASGGKWQDSFSSGTISQYENAWEVRSRSARNIGQRTIVGQ
jgi:hypothetical protein